MLYFYGGLLENDRRMIDAACGGNILNVTPVEAMNKIQEMAEGTRNFGRATEKKGVNAVDSNHSGMQNDINELKEMVKMLALQRTHQPSQFMQRQQGNAPSTETMLNTLTQHFTSHVQATESSTKTCRNKLGNWPRLL